MSIPDDWLLLLSNDKQWYTRCSETRCCTVYLSQFSFVKCHIRMIPVTSGFWPIFGPFDPRFWKDVQEISMENHISLENSWSALSHWTKPIYENSNPFLQGNGSKKVSRGRIRYHSSVTLHKNECCPNDSSILYIVFTNGSRSFFKIKATRGSPQMFWHCHTN